MGVGYIGGWSLLCSTNGTDDRLSYESLLPCHMLPDRDRKARNSRDAIRTAGTPSRKTPKTPACIGVRRARLRLEGRKCTLGGLQNQINFKKLSHSRAYRQQLLR